MLSHVFIGVADFDRALDACIGDAVAEKSLTETERRVAAVPTIAGLPRTPTGVHRGCSPRCRSRSPSRPASAG